MTPEPTVPALIPLSLLEALRNLDTPLEDGLAELSPARSWPSASA